MDLNTTFLKGRMNKSLDERVLPDGEYIDALNIRIGSTENNSVGAIENSLGNTKITSILYEGEPLSENARCIGAYEDSQHETIYWFVTDPGVVDMVLSYNDRTSTLIYHVISTSVLNFSTQHLVNGIDLIDNLLFWTDNYNPPRKIKVNRSYPYPTAGVDNITEDDISVIVAPPLESPTVIANPISGEENYMTDKFISFSYRYKYKDGEYSALSQFSEIAFEPQDFRIDYTFYGNGAMQNLFNSVNVLFNTGGENVVGIDLCFKLSDSSIVNVIERYDKEQLGWADNTTQSIEFNNKKIYTALPSSELTRLFDNVPRIAKSQTTMGNRLIYGNYVDGYDIDTEIDYTVEAISEDIVISQIPVTAETGVQYNINTLQPVTILDSKIKLDFTGVDITANSILNIDFAIIHADFNGSTLYDAAPPCEAPENNFNYNYSFNIQSDFPNAYQLSLDPGFINSIYTASVDSCNGFSVTDNFNCNIAAKNTICDPINDGWDKVGSGISAVGQGFTITSSPSEPNAIYIQFPAMKFVGFNDDTSQNEYAYEYFKESNTIASITRLNSRKSLHSNRDFEVAIVYQDDYLRSSTALVCDGNTVFFPASTSNQKNYIKATINNFAPSWAKRYKFVVKPSKSKYETIYTSLFFPDTNGFTWFKLEGENISKAKVGDTLIVKMDTEGYVGSLITTEVLEVKAQSNNFLTTGSNPQNIIYEPAGTYMRLKAANFSAEYRQNSFIEASFLRGRQPDGDSYRQRAVKLFYENPAFQSSSPNSFSNRRYIPYAIPAGSVITIKFNIFRNKAGLDGGCGSYTYLYEKTIVANADYDNFYELAIAQNINLETGVQGGGDELADITTTEQDNSWFVMTNTIPGPDGETVPVYPFLGGLPQQTGLNLVGFGKTEEDGEWDGSMYLLTASGIPGCSGKKAYNDTIVTLQLANGTLVFETEALDADGEIFYEGSDSFPIVDGLHMSGDADGDQDQTLTEPAVVTLNFFDCFSFGNGVESYKMYDALTGDPFYLGERVTAVAQEEYKAAHRYATLTYSGIYNAETNINRLNEFNLSLANFKDLERSFGPINRLYARRTDVLVLQEDKISYVLAGKNLLSDSTGGGQIASIPEVLGTQIARIEDYGISNNPESFAVFGGEVYFTDTKRNAVLNLRGGSAQSDALNVISDMGMKYWFRDEFKNSPNYFKIGGYDPYMDEYVLHLTETTMPTETDTYGCGVTISKQNVNGTYEFYVDLGNDIGEATFNLTLFSGEVNVVIEYDEVDILNETYEDADDYTFTFQKTTVLPDKIKVTITSINASYSTSTSCVTLVDYITVYRVVYNNPGSEDNTIHNKYRWTLGDYNSPFNIDFVTMEADGVSLYTSQTGGLSQGLIPADGSDITMISEKRPTDTFIFNPALNKFKYLVSNTLYTPETLLPLLNNITPITGTYQVTIPSLDLAGYDYLYLVWDYRAMQGVTMCYDETNPYVLCCSCPTSDIYYIDSTSFATASSIWLDENQVTVAPDGYYMVDDVYRQMLSGALLDPVPCNGCEPVKYCYEGVWSEEDPEHPTGGSVTYVDADGITVTQDNIFLGDTVTIFALAILSVTGVNVVECAPLYDWLYVLLTDPETEGCVTPPVTAFKIQSTTYNTLNNGDLAYELDGITPFSADGTYNVVASDLSNGGYTVEITSGVISIINICI